MKIKTIKNRDATSFNFYYNLSKTDALFNILKLYKLKIVYICIYNLRNNRLNEYNGIIFDRYYVKDLTSIVEIKVAKINDFLQILQNNFDEFVVWNCYKDFDGFINDMITPCKFLSIKKIKPNNCIPQFYLSFDHIDNIVDIICDISFNNSVSKELLNEILTK